MGAPLPRSFASAVEEAKSRLRARFGDRLKDVILFGSYAWGQPDQESDVDLFVLVEHLDHHERGAVFEIVGEVALEREVPLAPLAWTTEEFRERLAQELALAEDIQRLGVRL